MNDLKTSHTCPDMRTNVTEKYNEDFGNEPPLSNTRGRIHDYLGMALDFSCSKQVTITIIKCLQTILSDLPIVMTGKTITPAASYLFNMHDEGAEMLDGQVADCFFIMWQNYYQKSQT
jgi:hypothetical protein